MGPLYTIERWPLGWVLCSDRGLPLDVLSECGGLFPDKAVMVHGVVHHLHEARGLWRANLCVAGPEEATAWCGEIERSLEGLPPQERWWKGTHVGKSSAAIFSVLAADPLLVRAARRYAEGATPRDADDLSRCLRLLQVVPEFRPRLVEVAAAHPDSAWPKIVVRWDELEAMEATQQSDLLSKLNGG